MERKSPQFIDMRNMNVLPKEDECKCKLRRVRKKDGSRNGSLTNPFPCPDFNNEYDEEEDLDGYYDQDYTDMAGETSYTFVFFKNGMSVSRQAWIEGRSEEEIKQLELDETQLYQRLTSPKYELHQAFN